MKLHHLLLLLCLCCPRSTVSSSFSQTAFNYCENWPLLLSGCQEEPTPGATDAPVPVSDEEDPKKAPSCASQLFSTEERRSVGGAIERLGLQLLENLPIFPQQPNVILSPLSVALALAHLTLGESKFRFVCHTVRGKHFPPPGSPAWLYHQCNICFAESFFFFFLLLGAHNETEKLLLKTLHAHNLPCYHHILGRLLPHFKNTSLEVATRMYLRPGVWDLWCTLWLFCCENSAISHSICNAFQGLKRSCRLWRNRWPGFDWATTLLCKMKMNSNVLSLTSNQVPIPACPSGFCGRCQPVGGERHQRAHLELSGEHSPWCGAYAHECCVF